jgi:hypothetical protein
MPISTLSRVLEMAVALTLAISASTIILMVLCHDMVRP